MARKTKSPLAIPQTDNLWHCVVRKLRTFFQAEKGAGEYFRPSVFMVLDLKTGMILKVEIIREPIPVDELKKKLLGMMLKVPKGSGLKAHRPSEIQFEDAALAEALNPLLADVQVKARFQPDHELVDAILKDLEQSAFGGHEDEIPGLLQQRGVKPDQVGSLFSAARAFYLAEPWIQLSNFDILAVMEKSQKSPYFVIVMGQGGEEYGLSVFRNWQQVETFFGAAHPMDAIPRAGRHAFSFNEPPYVSFDDLDAIEKFGWALPAPDLFPRLPSTWLMR